MKDINIPSTSKTPSVKLIGAHGLIEIKGRSIPENSLDFYKPIIDWIDEYTKTQKIETKIHIQLEYFNTSSSKCLLDIFKRIETISTRATILWYYEQDDEDMLEAGEDYEAIINVPFKMIEIEQI